MKPRIFIGSSREGLNVAYAIQQNLTHDAEPTVWDQGIFELSRTTIESLARAVDDYDFGIFVFSPDDEIKMREINSNSIRDNVIFEFGLFTGRLGRDRVFFVKPDGCDMHLPTDLLGITPGIYNPKREDGLLQAATGPACNQIREAIKKLPIISSEDAKNESDESKDSSNPDKSEWIFDLFEDNYAEARNKLSVIMESNIDEDRLENKVWMAYIDFKENEVRGLDKLLKMPEDHRNSKSVCSLVAQMLSWDNYNDYALDVINRALEIFVDDISLLVLKSKILSAVGDKDAAIAILDNPKYSTFPDIAIALSEIYEGDDLGKAINIIHASYTKYPSSKDVAYKYARLLQEDDSQKEALYLLNDLCIKNPKEVIYLGYLSNTCLKLNLYDKAMASLKVAIECSKEKEAWLLHNVGNLLKNKGFYSEAEIWLRKGLDIEPSSEYALERLASAIKNRGDENKTFSAFCNEGKNLIRDRNRTNHKPNNIIQDDA